MPEVLIQLDSPETQFKKFQQQSEQLNVLITIGAYNQITKERFFLVHSIDPDFLIECQTLSVQTRIARLEEIKAQYFQRRKSIGLSSGTEENELGQDLSKRIEELFRIEEGLIKSLSKD